MRILYKFPSRGRPLAFFKHLDNISALARHDDYLIVPTLDLNDTAFTPVVKDKFFDEYYNKPGAKIAYPNFDRSVSKIHAINRDLDLFKKWDIVIATSDDMEIIELGFDLKIIQHMQENFSNTDGVLHYPDGYAHGPIVSWPVIGRKYYDRKGYIYHPGYQSLFCDEELYLVALAEGKLKSFPNETFLQHVHPMNTGNVQAYDNTYKQNDKFYKVDKAFFERRKRFNFHIK